MDRSFYVLIHIVGIVLIFSGLGGVFLHAMNGGTRASNPHRVWAAIIHGIGMALVIMGGFGLLAKLDRAGEFPPWVIAKLVIWLLLGASLSLGYRLPKISKMLWLMVVLLGATAAYLGINKLT